MYQWLKFIHIIGAFGFMLAHGISVGVLFKIRKETDRAKIAALLELSASSITILYVSLLLLLGGGIATGFAGAWWDRKWIWVSLGLLIVIIGLMYPLATKYFVRLREAVGERPSGAPRAADEELADLLTGSRPWVIAGLGFGGIAVITWLMIFKPF